MIAFVFYIVAILVTFTLVAAIADFSLWLQERNATAAESGEAVAPDGEKVL